MLQYEVMSRVLEAGEMEAVKTSGQVAQELGISVSLIRKMEYTGVTTPARRLNRFRVYSPAEVEQLRQIIQERRARRQRRPATA